MKTIVLVEDEVFILEVLVNYVQWEEYGINVIGSFTNPVDALNFLAHETCDILMTDIRMPKLTGLELIEKVNLLKGNMKIIILSGYDDFEYAKQGIRLGVFDYLLKPLDFEELDKVINRLIEELDKMQESFMEEKRFIFTIPKKINEKEFTKEIYIAIQSKDFQRIRLVWERYFDYIYINKINKEDTVVQISNIFNKLKEYIPIYERKLDVKYLLNMKKIKEMEEYINRSMSEFMEIYHKNEDYKMGLVNSIKKVMEEEYKSIQSASQLAERVNLSTSYTRELIKRYTGKTVNDYLREVRIEKARILLLESNLKIKYISQEVGYGTEGYFCKLFEHEKGLTPNEYRKKYRKMGKC